MSGWRCAFEGLVLAAVWDTRMLKKYDPDVGAPATEWLAADETERIELVRAYHHRARVRLPNERLHAVIHVIVENQLALGEVVVIETLDRLQREGLNRHDAVHAVGMVLSEHLHDLMTRGGDTPPAFHASYFERLKQLSAEAWLRSGS
jgi:hypothetical protein